MMKKILLLVTGMSPAIVTETVYGLAVNPTEGRDKWIPDEIHVISTEHGLVQVKDRLLKEGNFNKLLQDYNLPSIRFDESLLYPIVDEQGQPQYDLRTPQDNERAANLICEKVRQFTSDPISSCMSLLLEDVKQWGFILAMPSHYMAVLTIICHMFWWKQNLTKRKYLTFITLHQKMFL